MRSRLDTLVFNYVQIGGSYADKVWNRNWSISFSQSVGASHKTRYRLTDFNHKSGTDIRQTILDRPRFPIRVVRPRFSASLIIRRRYSAPTLSHSPPLSTVVEIKWTVERLKHRSRARFISSRLYVCTLTDIDCTDLAVLFLDGSGQVRPTDDLERSTRTNWTLPVMSASAKTPLLFNGLESLICSTRTAPNCNCTGAL